MKPFRILIHITLMLVVHWTTLGQGFSSFDLSNGALAAGVNAPVFDFDGVPLDAGYLVELWGGTTPESLVPAVNLNDNRNRLVVPFVGGGYFQSGEGFLAVPSSDNGGSSWLQIRAWDTDLGATYEAAVARGWGGYGESSLFFADGTDPFLVNPNPAAPLIGLESFSLRPLVPEPSTWALLVLGGVALGWIVRRRPR